MKPVNDLRAFYEEEAHVVNLTWTEVGELSRLSIRWNARKTKAIGRQSARYPAENMPTKITTSHRGTEALLLPSGGQGSETGERIPLQCGLG